MTASKKSSKRQLPKKFFVKDGNGIFVVKESYFDSLGSRAIALGIGLQCLSAIHHILEEDAVEGDDTYIGNMKVTTGLDRSLEELGRRFPNLLDEIHSTKRRSRGQRVYIC